MPDEPVMLPIRCQFCGQPVTLSYTQTVHYQKVWWNCPYVNCGKEHVLVLRASVVKAVARYEPPTK